MAKEQLKPKKGVVVTEINGVKYFKLQSNYPGDYTKNCGLLGQEIDENFYFLRSNDIDKMSVNNGILTLTRVDGDTLSADISMPYTFNFDEKTGKLIITDGNGDVQVLEGFVVEGKDVRIASDATLNGDGTKGNPLRISELEKTGTYAPANEFLDMTINDINLPDASNLGAGYRIVTRESKDNFGLLYNYDGVKKIQAALDATGSLWRIPTRKDWALMLNAAEYCEEDRDHDTVYVNEWTGKNAGARAKATTLWKGSNRQEKGLPVSGEDSLPIAGTNKFTVYPLGYADGSRGAEDEDFDLEAFTKKSSFWSITPTSSNGESYSSNIFTRTFAYDTRKVLQESSKPSSRMSIRLVKDFEPGQMDANEVENILGYDMPVVLLTNDETGYSKLWTSINVGFSEEQYDGVDSKEWSAATGSERRYEIFYYINEWDGKEWHKKQLSEGDSIVLLNGGKDESGNTIYNHEWRIYSGETGPMLIDTADALKKEFQKEIDTINDRIDEEISARTAADEDLQEQINEEVSARTAADEELRQRIDDLQIVEIEPEDETILASYILCEGESGDSKGVVINIPRDKSIYSIKLGDMGDIFEFPYEGNVHRTEQPDSIITVSTGHEAIRVIYHQKDGIYEMSLIDADAFLQFDEFKDGLESSSTETSVIIKVKIDEASDEYLTVSMDGVKLSGVKARFDELQEELDNIEKGAGLNEDGTYSPDVFARFISGATSLKDADSILDEKLGVEIERAEEAEEALDNKIDVEIARATEAENSISGDVTTLSASTIAFSAETVSEIIRLDNKIDTEIARATESENSISGDVTTLSAETEAFSAATVAEITRIDTKIDAEIERAEEAEEALDNKIDVEIDRSKRIDENIAKDLIGVSGKYSGDTENGFAIDFYMAEYVETDESHPESTVMDHIPDYEEIMDNDYLENPSMQYINYGGLIYELVPSTNYISNANNVYEALTALDNKAKETSDGLDNEIERAVARENEIDQKVDNEIIRATSAEAELQENIEDEIARAEEAEEALDNKIDEETARAQSAETALQADIDEVAGNVAELSGDVETIENEIERLDGEDIATDGTYEISATDGLILKRKNGEEISISFDGNFGTTMPTPLG